MSPPLALHPRRNKSLLSGDACVKTPLSFQGFPLELACRLAAQPGMSDKLFKDLAGNAYSGTIFASIMLAIIVHLPASQVEFCEGWEPSSSCLHSEAEDKSDLEGDLEFAMSMV